MADKQEPASSSVTGRLERRTILKNAFVPGQPLPPGRPSGFRARSLDGWDHGLGKRSLPSVSQPNDRGCASRSSSAKTRRAGQSDRRHNAKDLSAIYDSRIVDEHQFLFFAPAQSCRHSAKQLSIPPRRTCINSLSRRPCWTVPRTRSTAANWPLCLTTRIDVRG